MPDAALVRKTGIAEACPALTTPPRFRHRPYAFDMSSVVPLRSSSCQSPDLVLPRPFPSVLTTMAFDHSRRRWFGTCSCQPVPRGLPSSIKQLHTLGPPRPFALVAHNHRRSARTEAHGAPTPSPIRPGRCWTAAEKAGRLAECPPPWKPLYRPATPPSPSASAAPGAESGYRSPAVPNG